MLTIFRRLIPLCMALCLTACGAAGSVSSATTSTGGTAATITASAPPATSTSTTAETQASSAPSTSSAATTTASATAASAIASATATTTTPATIATASGTAGQTAYPLTVVDDHGTSVTIAHQPTHVVSLAPSATEIIYAVGRGDALVAGDQYDDYPPQAKAKAVIKGLKPSLESIIAYSPDLVLATSSNDQQLVDQLRATKVPVLMLDPNDFPGVYKDITLVGQAVNNQAEARQVVAGMQTKVKQVEDTTAHVTSRPRVFEEIDATDPTKPYTAGPGSFIDAMITEAGGTNVAHDAKTQYPQFSLEALLTANPQIIILQDSAYGVSAASVAQRTGWSTLAAVKDHHVYGIDDALVSRPAPRLADGLVALAKIIHPELFP